MQVSIASGQSQSGLSGSVVVSHVHSIGLIGDPKDAPHIYVRS